MNGDGCWSSYQKATKEEIGCCCCRITKRSYQISFSLFLSLFPSLVVSFVSGGNYSAVDCLWLFLCVSFGVVLLDKHWRGGPDRFVPTNLLPAIKRPVECKQFDVIAFGPHDEECSPNFFLSPFFFYSNTSQQQQRRQLARESFKFSVPQIGFLYVLLFIIAASVTSWPATIGFERFDTHQTP